MDSCVRGNDGVCGGPVAAVTGLAQTPPGDTGGDGGEEQQQGVAEGKSEGGTGSEGSLHEHPAQREDKWAEDGAAKEAQAMIARVRLRVWRLTSGAQRVAPANPAIAASRKTNHPLRMSVPALAAAAMATVCHTAVQVACPVAWRLTPAHWWQRCPAGVWIRQSVQ